MDITKEQKRFKKRYRTFKKLITAAIILAIGLFVFLVETHPSKALKPTDENEVFFHFIDVGQGDSALIQTTAGAVLIDAGTVVSEDALKAYLDSLGVSKIEYAVFTHPHEDHIGGADMVLRHFDVKRVVIPQHPESAVLWSSVIQTAAAHGCEILYAAPDLTWSV